MGPSSRARPRRLLATLILASLALTMPIQPIGAQGQTASPQLEFVDADLQPFPPGVGPAGDGAAVFVRFTSPTPADANRGFLSLRGITISSTRAAGGTLDAGWPIDLLETAPGSGVFTGSFRVAPPAAQSAGTPRAAAAPALSHPEFGKIFGDGILRIEAGGKLIAQYGAARAEAAWQPGANGDFFATLVGGALRGHGSRIDLRVTDKDLNADPKTTERYAGLLLAYSDSAPTGLPIPLGETDPQSTLAASSANSAVFTGSISLTDRAALADAGLLFVKPGDRVWAIYRDRTDATGHARYVERPAPGADPWIFEPSTTGTISIGESPQFVRDVEGASGPAPDGIYDAPLVVTVMDIDPSRFDGGVRTVNVSLAIATGGQEAKLVTLPSLGDGVGMFQSSVAMAKPVSEGGPTDASLQSRFADAWLRVPSGATVRASYDDLDQDGVPVRRSAESRMLPLADAVLRLGASAGTGRMTGTADARAILLEDADANVDPYRAEQVVVLLRTSLDPTGVPITLGESSDNTGVFVGNFRFTNGAAQAGAVRVVDGDVVVGEYVDAHPASGPARTVRSNLVTWRQYSAASLSFDSASYARQMPAASCLWNETARLIVRDPDQNDPSRIDAVDVTIHDEGGTEQALAAIETGSDTGVYVAEIVFGRMGSGCPSSPARFLPSLAPGISPGDRIGNRRTLRASYFDPTGVFGAPAESLAQAEWFESVGLLRFESSWAPGGEATTVVSHDVAADAEVPVLSSASEGTRTFLVAYSQAAPDGLLVATDTCPDPGAAVLFRQSPAGSGRWVANVTVTTDVPLTGNPCVPPAMPDTTRIQVKQVAGRSVVDHVHVYGLPQGLREPPLVVRGTTAGSLLVTAPSSSSMALAFGDHASPRIQMTDGSLNRDAEWPDIIEARAQAEAPVHGNTITTRLVETGPDTDVFVGSLSLADGVGLPARSVASGDPELLTPSVLRSAPHRRVCFWDSGNPSSLQNNPDSYANNDSFEPMYLRNGNVCGAIQAGDVRLTSSGGILAPPSVGGAAAAVVSAASFDLYPGGTVVRPGDLDVGQTTIDTWSEHYNGTTRVVPL
jgi:hypothetical protein